MKKLKEWSWMGIVNKLILQWFFVRLTRHVEKRIIDFKLMEVSLMPDGSMSSGGTGKTETWQWYSIQFWILPLSGWKNKFIYLNKTSKFIKCTKPVLITK